MPAPTATREDIAALKALVTMGERRTGPVLPFGVAVLDLRVAGGGLASHALHEVAPRSSTLSDDAAATLFTAGIGGRLASDRAGVFWAATRFDLYAPGLEQAGLPPARLLHAEVREDADVLALVEDAVRHGAFAAVVAEVRRAGMTATRRLQLAAAEGRSPVILLRRWRRAGACPLAEPSAATTRWRIGSAPSVPLGVPGVGRPCWSVELARQRGGEPFSIILGGCDAQGRLAPPAAVRHRAAAAGGAAVRFQAA